MLTRRSLLARAGAFTVLPYIIGNAAALAATPKSILVMAKAIDDIVGGFDPAEAYEASNIEVCGSLYRTLVTIDPTDTTKLIGDLAESWKVSQDGRSITFKVREGQKFESGNPITAEDVVFSLQRAIRLAKGPSYTLSPFGWTADNAAELIKAEGDTVSLNAKSSAASGILLSCLTTTAGGVIEKKAVLENEVDGDLGNTWLKAHSASSGPYRLVEWQASERIVLEASPHADSIPAIPRLVIQHVSDPSTQLLLLSKGDVDIARDLGADELKSIRDKPEYNFVNTDSLQQMYLGMNMGGEQLKSEQVRQAIKWAIDYRSIAEHLTAHTWSVWQSFEPKGIPGAISGNFQKDLAKAKGLLAEGGFAEGFSITLDHYAAKPFSDIAQAIQADLGEVGIKVELVSGERKQVTTKMRARQHQMIIGVWTPEYPIQTTTHKPSA